MKFRTINGSTLTLTGKHLGIKSISWDWLEERHGLDCTPVFNRNLTEPGLEINCDCGGPKFIRLMPVEELEKTV